MHVLATHRSLRSHLCLDPIEVLYGSLNRFSVRFLLELKEPSQIRSNLASKLAWILNSQSPCLYGFDFDHFWCYILPIFLHYELCLEPQLIVILEELLFLSLIYWQYLHLQFLHPYLPRAPYLLIHSQCSYLNPNSKVVLQLAFHLSLPFQLLFGFPY